MGRLMSGTGFTNDNAPAVGRGAGVNRFVSIRQCLTVVASVAVLTS